MAARTSWDGGGAQSVRIQSQYVRENQTGDDAGPISGFAIIPEGEALPPIASLPGRGSRRLEANVQRAIAAAKAAKLGVYRIEITPDGTISLIVGIGPAGDSPRE